MTQLQRETMPGRSYRHQLGKSGRVPPEQPPTIYQAHAWKSSIERCTLLRDGLRESGRDARITD